MKFFLRLLVFLALSLFKLKVLALSTETLSDGRIIRVPGRKPLPPVEYSLFDTAKFNITRHERRPKKKPPPPGGVSNDHHDTQGRLDGSMCGLDTPSADNWEANKDHIAEWFTKQFDDYLQTGEMYTNVALFLRDRWAPSAVSSSLFCDAIGSCSIGSCKNLIADDGTNHHDRQMALYVFEQLANADHLYKLVDKQVTDVINDILHRSSQFVEEFSSADRIEKALKDELKKEQIALAIGQALGLVINAGFAFIGGNAGKDMARTSVNLLVSTYIGMVTVLNEFRANPDFVDDLKEAFHNDLSAVLYKAKGSIVLDLQDLMIGEKDYRNRTVVDLMTDSSFLEPERDLFAAVGDHVGRVVTGTAINKMYEFDRAFFVLVNNPGGCEKEKTVWVRGPTAYLVCLPEHPNLGFWLYSIDRYHENDFGHDSHGNVRGPTGFWRLDGEDQKYFGINLQDVARSSYWAHKQNLVEKKGERIKFDPLDIDATIRVPDEKDRMNGVFTIPICRNPGGESISGVMDEKGQNYPCMCGEFSWRGGWSWEKDETPKFLARSGFMFSEDFEDWCSSKNKCKGKNDIDLKSQLNVLRKKDDPPIPHDLKHPFKKCKKRRDSRKHPGWPDRDMGKEARKRNQIGWAKYDEQGRNTSRAVVSYEG